MIIYRHSISENGEFKTEQVAAVERESGFLFIGDAIDPMIDESIVGELLATNTRNGNMLYMYSSSDDPSSFLNAAMSHVSAERDELRQKINEKESLIEKIGSKQLEFRYMPQKETASKPQRQLDASR